MDQEPDYSEQLDGLELQKVLEAILFAAPEPISLKRLVDCIDSKKITAREIEEEIANLNRGYAEQNSGLRVVQLAGGYQLSTDPRFDKWIRELQAEKQARRLSQSALEVLAIVAYKQPTTRQQIEKVRGVNPDWSIRTLLEKELVSVVGREEAPGRPLLFGTTSKFLEHFGLNDVSELPQLKEIDQLLKEDKEFAEALTAARGESPESETESTEGEGPETTQAAQESEEEVSSSVASADETPVEDADVQDLEDVLREETDNPAIN